MKRQVASTITILLFLLLAGNTGFSQTQVRNPDNQLGTTITNEFKISNGEQLQIFEKDINVGYSIVWQTSTSIETEIRMVTEYAVSARLSLSLTDANTFETHYLCENMTTQAVENTTVRIAGDISALSQSIFHVMKLRIVFFDSEGKPVGVFMDTKQIQTIY